MKDESVEGLSEHIYFIIRIRVKMKIGDFPFLKYGIVDTSSINQKDTHRLDLFP